jgi:AsmA protein
VKKPLKTLAIVLGSLVVLLIVGVVTLTIVFNPNRYKPQIIQAVKEKTGRELKIGKNIGWSFFPNLGIEAGGLELSNAPGFGKEPFAKIDAAGVGVELLPLFRGRITVDKVYLHGLALNLAKNAAGRTNWDDLVAASKETPKTAEKPAATKGEGANALGALSVGRLEVKNANVVWRDEAAGSTVAVKNLELTTGTFASGKPMDLHLAFELARDRAPAIKIGLNGDLTFAPDLLKLAKLNLAVDDSHLTGGLEVRNFARPAINFDLALDQIDLDRYLSSEPAAKTGAGTKPAAAQPVALPLATLRSLDVRGKLRIQKLKAMNLQSTDALVQVNARNGLIDLGPNEAKLYGGAYRGQTSLDVRGKTPALSLNEALSGVQLAPLLQDAYKIGAFQGDANLNAKLTAQGFDAAQITRTLSGNAAFDVKNGLIRGVDIGKMVDAVNAAVRDRNTQALVQLVPAKGDDTKFTQLGGTVQVRNGIARNDDLAIDVPNLGKVTGKGSADLPAQRLDYRLTVGKLPIVVSGPFANLKYTPDVQTVAKHEVERKLKNELEDKLREKLKLR